jgi:ribosomal protein S18 acetylase RimI-like enzyme
MKLREISGPPGREMLAGFDASFLTEHIYRVSVTGMNVSIREEKLPTRLHKTYELKHIEESVADADSTVLAEIDGEIAGFAAFKYHDWNKRAEIKGIYVRSVLKGRGVGAALLNNGLEYAKTKGARGLWLETQNINYPAIRFYMKSGFRFCGFDASLYEPAAVMPAEIALYFFRETGFD